MLVTRRGANFDRPGLELIAVLNEDQVAHFWEHGYVTAAAGIGAEDLVTLTGQLDGWIKESREHDANYGFDTEDGKARFDLEDGHSKQHPKLRRVSNPVDVSEAYRKVLWEGSIPDMVADLIGPNVKFHHCKLNIKLPGMETKVEYHQDHAYDPHTNDDMLAILALIDDMSEENGCIRVVPGSYRHHYSHFQDGEFTGMTPPDMQEEFEKNSVPIEGKAGDVCLMHTWTVHGGGPNRSDKPRRLLICDYNAADAFPLTSPAIPSPFTGRIVRGEASRVARLTQTELEIRVPYDHDSFFGLTGQKAAGDS